MKNFYAPENANDVSDLLEHANAGHAGSSVVSGHRADDNLSTAEQRKKEEELRHFRIAVLNGQIDVLEQEIIVLEKRIERHEELKNGLNTIQQDLEKLPSDEIAAPSTLNDMKEILADAKNKIPDGQTSVVIDTIEEQLEELGPNATNRDYLQVCIDGQCMARDSIAADQNSIQFKTDKIAEYKQEIVHIHDHEKSSTLASVRSGFGLGMDKSNLSDTFTANANPAAGENTAEKTQETQDFETLDNDYDFTLEKLHNDIKAQLDGGATLSAAGRQQFIEDNPGYTKAIDNFLDEKQIKVEPEATHTTHVPLSSAYNAQSPSANVMNFNAQAAPALQVTLAPKPDLDRTNDPALESNFSIAT